MSSHRKMLIDIFSTLYFEWRLSGEEKVEGGIDLSIEFGDVFEQPCVQ